MNPFHSLLPYLFKTHFNTIHTSMPISSQRSNSSSVSYRASLWISLLLSVCRICIFDAQYQLWNHFLWSLYCGTSFFLPLCSKHYLNALFSNTLKCMFLPEREKPSFTPTYHKTPREENMGKWKHKRNLKQSVLRCRKLVVIRKHAVSSRLILAVWRPSVLCSLCV